MSTSRWIGSCMGLAVVALVGCGGRYDVGGDQPDGQSGSGGSLGTGGAGGGGGPDLPYEASTGLDEASTAEAATDEAALPEECPCTRRPGPGNSLYCPVGSGTSATLVITDAGGTVALSGTMSTAGVSTRLEIPPGALHESISITITETELPPPANYVDGSPIYRFEMPDLALAKPAVLTIGWSVKSGVVPDLAIYAGNGESFEKLADQYPNAGFIQATLTQLSSRFFFVGAPKSASQQSCP